MGAAEDAEDELVDLRRRPREKTAVDGPRAHLHDPALVVEQTETP